MSRLTSPTCLLVLLTLLFAIPAGAADLPAFWNPSGERMTTADERAPKIGTIKGSWDMASTDLTFDRVAWTMQGVSAGKPVNLAWDHENGTIKGSVGSSVISLKVDWSTEKVTLEGIADGQPIQLICDWTKKTIDGEAHGGTVALTFDMDKGSVDGLCGGGMTKLVYSKQTGALTGLLGVDLVALKLTNLDLYDFLMHLYIFLR